MRSDVAYSKSEGEAVSNYFPFLKALNVSVHTGDLGSHAILSG